MRSNLILLMCVTYLVSYFLHFDWLQWFLGALTIIVFVGSLGGAKTAPRAFSLVMFSAAAILVMGREKGMEEMFANVSVNLSLLTLVTLVPLMAIPLRTGGFFPAIHYTIAKWTADPRKLFGGMALFVFCLGPLLNMGAIRILHEMVREVKLGSTFLAKAYLLGFSALMLWSPYFASVASVLLYLDVPIQTYLPLGFSLAVVQLLVGNVLFAIWLRRQKGTFGRLSDDISSNEQIHMNKKMKQLAAIVIGLMLATLLLEYATKLPMLILVILIVITFPLTWCVASGKWKEWKESFQEFRRHSVPMMNNEIVLMISAGFFGQALNGTTFAEGVESLVNALAAESFLLFVVTVMLSFVMLTFLGIHPLVLVTILASSMDAEMIGTSKAVLALMLMISWSISSVLSPTNPLNILVSSLVQQPGIRVGARDNGLLLASSFVLGVLYVYWLH